MIKVTHSKLAWVGLICLYLYGANAFATVIDDFNAGQPQAPNTFWSPITEIGWYYTPSVSYTLGRVETVFTQTTSGGDVNRDVTLAIFTDRPAAGGTVLGSGSFNSSTARGVYGGVTFPVGAALTGGTRYFVGLSNILNLGVNQVSFNPDPAGPPGSVAIGTTWATGQPGFGSMASDGTTWFDKPVMRFSTVPEPATIGGTVGLAGIATLRRRRTERSRTSSP